MSTLRLTTIANQGNTASVPSETVINGSAKAWVNFNGTGTVAIRASFNVSSITDNGTGDYTVNFTTAMPDASYAGMGAASDDGGYLSGRADAFRLSSSFRVATKTDAGVYADYAGVYVAIFR